jgi:hypothetical protein
MPDITQHLEKTQDFLQLSLKEQSVEPKVNHLKWYQRFLKRLGQLNDILGGSQTLAQTLMKGLGVITAIGTIFNYVWNMVDITFSFAQLIQDAHRFKTRLTSRVKNGLQLGFSILTVALSAPLAVFTFYAVSVGAIALGPLCFAIAAGVAAIRSGYLFFRSCFKSSREGLLKDREGSIRVLEEKLSVKTSEEVEQSLNTLNGKEDEYSTQKRHELQRLRRLKLQQEALSKENPKADWQRKLQEDLLLEQRSKRNWNLFKFATSVMFAVSFSLLCVPFPPLMLAGSALVVAAAAVVTVGNVARYCKNSYHVWHTEDARKRLAKSDCSVSYDDKSLSNRYLTELNLFGDERKKYWDGLSPRMQQAKIQEQLLKEEERKGLKQNSGKQILRWFKHELASPSPKFSPVTGLLSAASNIARGIGWLLKKAAMLVCVSMPVLAVAAVAAVKDAVFSPKPLMLATQHFESDLPACIPPGRHSSDSLNSSATTNSQQIGQESEQEEVPGSAPPISDELRIEQPVMPVPNFQAIKVERKESSWSPFGRYVPSSRRPTTWSLFFGREKFQSVTQSAPALLQEKGHDSFVVANSLDESAPLLSYSA